MTLPATPAVKNEIGAEATETPWKLIGMIAGIVTIPALWFAPLPLEAPAQHALAISCFMVIFWITETLPHAVTGLVGCWLFWALGVVPSRTAFSGFGSEAPWFLLGALFIGLTVTETGLAKRLAYRILSAMGTYWPNVLLGLLLTDFLMTFMIPAGPPRIILLGTIVLGIVASFGLDAKSNIARGAILAVTFSATLFDKTIIGSTPSILARTLIVEHGKVPVYWTQWFIAYFPLDVINILAAWWLIQRMYPAETMQLPGGKQFLEKQLQSLGPWTAGEKRALMWVLVAVAMWATDFLHRINPAVVGMGVGLATMMPYIGVLRPDDMKKLNYNIFLFMGTTVSMGEVLRETRALEFLSNSLFTFLGPFVNNVLQSTVVLYWAAFVGHLILASETAMVAATMPLVMNFGLQNNLDPLALGLVWSFATGGKLFIYQSAVLIAGYSFGCFNARDVFRMGIFFLIAESLLLLLVVPFYWPLIGIG